MAARIKSINAIQKYPHIAESYGYILEQFVTVIYLSRNVSVSFGICSTQKLSK